MSENGFSINKQFFLIFVSFLKKVKTNTVKVQKKFHYQQDNVSKPNRNFISSLSHLRVYKEKCCVIVALNRIKKFLIFFNFLCVHKIIFFVLKLAGEMENSKTKRD